MGLSDLLVHKFLRVPYAMHTTVFRAPKNPKETIVLLHGIGNSALAWNDVVPLLPKNVRIIGVDLLGFGKSPKPTWLKYNATAQARSLGATLLKLGINHRIILVGHSLGALVSVATAKRYPFLVKNLVLCSPPFYRPSRQQSILPQREDILREMYKTASKYPHRLIELSPLAVKMGLANKVLNIDDDNIFSYQAALGSSIMNQTSMEDLRRLTVPTSIIYGTLDPVVIGGNINSLSKTNKKIFVKKIVAGHEVVGRYANVLSEEVKALIG